ncbi:MAG: hypothetical protein ACLP9C_06310 [Acidimicrobiales bacterium]
MAPSGYVEVAEGWSRLRSRGFGPFVTFEELRRPDGSTALWDSRRHRKHSRATGPEPTWWAPRALGWWIGVLFALGSACFALGAFPPYATALGARTDSITYFVGSLFFTTAAFCQYTETVRASPLLGGAPERRWRRLLAPEPRRIDWWAAAVQFVGTLLFNRSTFQAIVTSAGPASLNHDVWRPDVFGSICFLVASGLAWFEVCHGAWAWRPRSISWWITALNLAGSVAFGVSAAAAYVEPDGSLRSLALTNLGTFVGALCFLAGGVLLLPERTAGPPAPPVSPAVVAPAGS